MELKSSHLIFGLTWYNKNLFFLYVSVLNFLRGSIDIICSYSFQFTQKFGSILYVFHVASVPSTKTIPATVTIRIWKWSKCFSVVNTKPTLLIEIQKMLYQCQVRFLQTLRRENSSAFQMTFFKTSKLRIAPWSSFTKALLSKMRGLTGHSANKNSTTGFFSISAVEIYSTISLQTGQYLLYARPSPRCLKTRKNTDGCKYYGFRKIIFFKQHLFNYI